MGIKEDVAKLDKASKSKLGSVNESRVKFEFHLSGDKKAENSPLLVGDAVIPAGKKFAEDATYKHFTGKCFRKPDDTLVFLTKASVDTTVETLFARKVRSSTYGHKGAVVFSRNDNPDDGVAGAPAPSASAPTTPGGSGSRAAGATDCTESGKRAGKTCHSPAWSTGSRYTRKGAIPHPKRRDDAATATGGQDQGPARQGDQRARDDRR